MDFQSAARLAPVSGAVALGPADLNEPRRLPVTAGGDWGAGEDCPGSYAQAPTIVLDYIPQPGAALVVRGVSNTDTVLFMRTPSGDMECNDDSDGVDPRLRIRSQTPGRYHIWLGSYTSEDARSPAEIVFGRSAASLQPTAALQDRRLTPTLLSGFPDDPHEIAAQIGGDLSLREVLDSEGCYGNVSATPTARVSYIRQRRSRLPLIIGVESDLADPVLAIRDPEGDWYCNDDGGDGLNSRIVFSDPKSGNYAIFAGVLSGESASGVVTISERPPQRHAPDPSLRAAEAHTLSPGFAAMAMPVMAGGEAAATAIREDPHGVCVGFMTVRPTMAITATTPFVLRVDSPVDTTLAVYRLPTQADGGRATRGQWFCNDDGGAAFDPALALQQGAYAVYVGNYESPTPAAANLVISRE
ncbi:MAG: hypothetical protein GC206_10175 [Alphaproteobacteria bacterium]|nr:hypothetical protein [Alphaproteobacteria bacterium]